MTQGKIVFNKLFLKKKGQKTLKKSILNVEKEIPEIDFLTHHLINMIRKRELKTQLIKLPYR